MKTKMAKCVPIVMGVLSCVGVTATLYSAIKRTKAITEDEDICTETDDDIHDADTEEEVEEETKKNKIVKAVKSELVEVKDGIIFVGKHWRTYMPTLIIFSGTMASIIFTTSICKKSSNAVIAASMLSGTTFNEYRRVVKEKYGSKADKDIMNSIKVESCKRTYIDCNGPTSSSRLIDPDYKEDEILFYDLYSKRYFHSTLARVIDAEYNLNRNFALGAAPCVNDFYEFLGLDEMEGGDIVGWDTASGITWIDFNNELVKMEDGMECQVISMLFEPEIFDDL